MPTQIVGDDSEVVGEGRRKIVENVRIVETAVDEYSAPDPSHSVKVVNLNRRICQIPRQVNCHGNNSEFCTARGIPIYDEAQDDFEARGN